MVDKIIDIIGIIGIELIHIITCIECFKANIFLGIGITTLDLLFHFFMYKNEIKHKNNKNLQNCIDKNVK